MHAILDAKQGTLRPAALSNEAPPQALMPPGRHTEALRDYLKIDIARRAALIKARGIASD